MKLRVAHLPVVLLILMLQSWLSFGQSSTAEHNVQKASFILEAAAHYEWPKNSLRDSFRILILDNKPLYKRLKQSMTAPFTLNGLPVSLHQRDQLVDWQGVNLVYLHAAEEWTAEDAMKASTSGTLLIGDGFGHSSLMLNLHELKMGSLGYDVNDRLIKSADIKESGPRSFQITELSKRDWERGQTNQKSHALAGKVLALYTVNFIKYTKWPEGALDGETLDLAIVGDSVTYKQIRTVLEENPDEQRIHGKTLKVQWVANIDTLDRFDAVYVDYAEGIPAAELLGQIQREPILLMTYGYGYNQTMLNIFQDGNTIRFQLNDDQAIAHDLSFEDALYTLSSEVDEADWKELVSQYHQNLQVEKAKNRELTKEVDDLNLRVEALNADIAQLEEDIARRTKELELIQVQIDKKLRDFKVMELQLASKAEELTNAKEQVTEMEQNVQKKEEELRSSEIQLSEQREELGALVSNYHEVEQEMSNALKLLNNQRIIIYSMVGIAFIFLLLGGLAYYNFRKQRQHAKVIQQQKKKVEAQRDEIEEKHLQLEEKNREITDSITYAKRIQDAILPPEKLVDAYLSENFIFYKPKDIVAGDFYWLEPVKDQVYFAAADCTGHGVPGAMVSVLCNNGLNRSVREFGLRKPNEILNKTRELVIQEFEKSEEEVKDGMDIAFCVFDRKTHMLQYAGAQNPLWVISKRDQLGEGVEQKPAYSIDSVPDVYLHEVKADKEPIGKYASSNSFSNHEVQLEPGDIIYLFSDGYADQFGGTKGKKLKYRPFKDLVLDHHSLPMSEQHDRIQEYFEEWRGDLEQIDDVVVFGVRV